MVRAENVEQAAVTLGPGLCSFPAGYELPHDDTVVPSAEHPAAQRFSS